MTERGFLAAWAAAGWVVLLAVVAIAVVDPLPGIRRWWRRRRARAEAPMPSPAAQHPKGEVIAFEVGVSPAMARRINAQLSWHYAAKGPEVRA